MSGIKPQLRHKGGEDVSLVSTWPGTSTHSKWRTIAPSSPGYQKVGSWAMLIMFHLRNCSLACLAPPPGQHLIYICIHEYFMLKWKTSPIVVFMHAMNNHNMCHKIQSYLRIGDLTWTKRTQENPCHVECRNQVSYPHVMTNNMPLK